MAIPLTTAEKQIRKDNAKRVTEMRKAAKETNTEYYKVRKAIEREKNARMRTVRGRTKARRTRDRLRAEVFAHYGGKCTCCGETRTEFLSIDHKDNDGAAHRKEIGETAHHLYAWAKKNGYPDRLQILCFNCNFTYGKLGYCPHMIEAGLISRNDAEHLRQNREVVRMVMHRRIEV